MLLEDTDHLFRVEVNGETALEIEETNDMWHPYQIEVDQPGPVEIRFVATRGNNWQGDTALDFISISQGLCTEEFDD
ncbi:MAM domain-containing glycosylphosphatidylinositol anchor protein 1-like [Ciona intestinalis]